MQYRQFGQLDWQVSALGFGCMRLPTEGSPGEIEEPEATRMLRYAIDRGLNYVDTAYRYHDGSSEPFLARALQDGYREKVRVATKLPSWLVEDEKDFDRYLDEQMENLQVDYLDFYLLHALKKDWWRKLRDLGVREWAEGAIADGRIGHLGFSFHDDYDVFKEIVDEYDWTFCQIQYNYMDVENQAGLKGLQYAASKGMAVVIMEPLLGGKLVDPPASIQAIWARAGENRSPAGWALQWLWDQPEVSVVLSGMSTMTHVRENVASADRSAVGVLTPDDMALVEEVRAKYEALCPIPCTQCGYCMPCPNDVDIPTNFRTYNHGSMYDKVDIARKTYSQFIKEEKRASACIQCGECEEKCPQRISISEWMPRVHAVLGDDQPYGCFSN